MTKAQLRKDWIAKARADGKRDRAAAETYGDPARFLEDRLRYLTTTVWPRQEVLTDDDRRVLEAAWCKGANVKVSRKNPDESPRVYLAAPSGARGRWVPADEEDSLNMAIKEITNNGKGDWQVHDYEHLPNLGENPSVEDIVRVAGWVGEHGAAVTKAAVDISGVSYLDEAERFLDNGYGQYESLEKYAEQLHEDGGLSNEFLLRHVDWEGVARDLDAGGDINSADLPGGGIVVFSESR